MSGFLFDVVALWTAATAGQTVMVEHAEIRMVAATTSQAGATQWRVHSSLLLKEAMDFEPIGAAAVAGAALGHAHQEALAQSAGLARRPVLLVDDAHAAVLAFADSRHIAVRPTEKRLGTNKRRNRLVSVHLKFTVGYKSNICIM